MTRIFMKIAITGPNGFVGSYLCRYSLDEKIEASAISRQPVVTKASQSLLVQDYLNIPKMMLAMCDCNVVIHLVTVIWLFPLAAVATMNRQQYAAIIAVIAYRPILIFCYIWDAGLTPSMETKSLHDH